MAALPYIQLYVADYLADTAHLTTEEHGAYLLLIFNYWQRGEPLPDNDAKLSRIVRMDLDSWLAVRPMIAEFFMVEDGVWLHNRVETDLAKVREKSTKASQAGKKSAARRLSDDGETGVKRTFNGRSAEVDQSLNHTDTDTDTDTDSLGQPPCACPHNEIVKLYHEKLPTLARVREWTEDRQKLLRARWREKPERQNLEWWSGFFDYVSHSDFLMGRVERIGGAPAWEADLEWLLRPRNFVKVIEGRYK